jgi:GNAT superfamily N-acetyltransferase
VTTHSFTMRPGRAGDALALSALALRSKAHWGYDARFLEACRDELTIAPAEVETLRILVVEVDGAPAGFVSLAGTPPVGDLEHLFVDPPFIGAGLGRTLFEAAVALAQEAGFARITVDADPGAEGFYLRMGAVRAGSSPSGSIPGRVLPHLGYVVPAT